MTPNRANKTGYKIPTISSGIKQNSTITFNNFTGNSEKMKVLNDSISTFYKKKFKVFEEC